MILHHEENIDLVPSNLDYNYFKIYFYYHRLPMFIAFFLCAIIYNWDIETSDKSDIKMSDNKRKDVKTRTAYFVDKKGNAAGTATTYDYGNHSETYIKDNFGNVEVESKSYDNYRETKLK